MGWLAKQIARAKKQEAKLARAYGKKVWAAKVAIIRAKYERHS